MDRIVEMPDLSYLTLDEVYQKYKNKEIKKSVVIALLREKIIKSKKNEILERIFELLELFDLNPEQYYYLVSFMSDNTNELIKEKAYRIMIRDYFEKCKVSLKYSVINENKFRVICAIYTELSKKNTEEAQKLIDILEKRFSWKHTSFYDVNSKEAMGLGIIELIFEGVGIGVTEPCALSECCINFTVENGHVISLLANEVSIPLLEILLLFPKLKFLYLEMGSVDEIKDIDGLENLKHLEITYSCLSEIKNLQNLKTLKLNGNKIKKIKGLENLVNLEELELDENQIIEIENLGTLMTLKSLSLAENSISEINGLENNTNIELLSLSGNCIKEIKGLDNLTKLEKLFLSENRISEINGLENLSELRILDLGKNLIREIKNIENLGNLEKIDLKGNKIPERVMEEIKDPDDAQVYVNYSRYKDYRKLDYWK